MTGKFKQRLQRRQGSVAGRVEPRMAAPKANEAEGRARAEARVAPLLYGLADCFDRDPLAARFADQAGSAKP